MLELTAQCTVYAFVRYDKKDNMYSMLYGMYLYGLSRTNILQPGQKGLRQYLYCQC